MTSGHRPRVGFGMGGSWPMIDADVTISHYNRFCGRSLQSLTVFTFPAFGWQQRRGRRSSLLHQMDRRTLCRYFALVQVVRRGRPGWVDLMLDWDNLPDLRSSRHRYLVESLTTLLVYRFPDWRSVRSCSRAGKKPRFLEKNCFRSLGFFRF